MIPIHYIFNMVCLGKSQKDPHKCSTTMVEQTEKGFLSMLAVFLGSRKLLHSVTLTSKSDLQQICYHNINIWSQEKASELRRWLPKTNHLIFKEILPTPFNNDQWPVSDQWYWIVWVNLLTNFGWFQWLISRHLCFLKPFNDISINFHDQDLINKLQTMKMI